LILELIINWVRMRAQDADLLTSALSWPLDHLCPVPCDLRLNLIHFDITDQWTGPGIFNHYFYSIGYDRFCL
jgi:hypothetical protein